MNRADLSWLSAEKAELMALDRLSVYATATRYPSPSGRLPRVPDQATIESEFGAVADLLARARVFLGMPRR